MKITIGGLPGSGKTSVGKLLAEKLGYVHYSVGDLRGQMAQERGLTIDELNKLGETEDWTDKEADARTERLGKVEENFIIDGWMAFHFIPDAAKIFLKVDAEEAARRVFRDQRPDEKKHDTVGGVRGMLEERYEHSRRRYQKWYCVDIGLDTHYDLVLDTTGIPQAVVVQNILEFVQKVFKPSPSTVGNPSQGNDHD